MEGLQRQADDSFSGGDLMLDPEVVDVFEELDRLRRASTMSMTAAEQAQVLGMIIDEKQARKRASQDDNLTASGAQFDEEAMEEAVRATKRRRLASKADLSGAHKMYAYGPEEKPPGFDHDGQFDGPTLDAEIIGLDPDIQGAYCAQLYDLHSVTDTSPGDPSPKYKPGFDLLESVCSSVELAVEVAKHLRVSDIVNLYSTSRSFHGLLNNHWQSSIFAWADYMAPSSLRIFYWKFFGQYTRLDPTGTTWAAPGRFADAISLPRWTPRRPAQAGGNNTRDVPGLRYLAMIVERETRVRDILAMLARSGHRLPKTCNETLKKIWLLMDLPTNTQRRAFIRSGQLWSGEDIYNAQMFVVKLQMRFNEPLAGPDSPQLAETLLGSEHGLTPLWQTLRGKSYTDLLEAMQMRVRYLAHPGEVIHRGQTWQTHYNVPFWQLGRGHCEGWGQGSVHLSRPDELVVEEAVRRGIKLRDHLMFMVFWGYVNWGNLDNVVPSEEEMYMSDDEDLPLSASQRDPDGILGNCGNVPFDRGNWKPQNILQQKWDTLTEKEKLALNEDIEHDGLRMFAHEEDEDEGFWDLDADEMSRLNHGRKKEVVSGPEDTDSESDDETGGGGGGEELLMFVDHPDYCVCETCIRRVCQRNDGYDTDEHADTCLCEECLDRADEEAEEEDYEDSEEEDPEVEDEESDAEEAEADGGSPPPGVPEEGILIRDPMPEEVLTNPNLRDVWDQLRPEDRQNITLSLDRQRELQRASAAGAAPTGPAPQAHAAPRQFPNITDPVSLALLRKLDAIPAGVTGGSQPAAEGDNAADEDVDMDAEEERDGGDDDDDDAGESSMDDEQLKALADEDYSDDELDFDMTYFQAFMNKSRDDGSFHYGADSPGDGDSEDGFGMAHESDLRSPTTATEMKLPDIRNY
ncbi:hypothetical protein diail_8829 [Diaporthe ilicicola]|nr:hypothetical protein diail_8829 [Diaporthe ilicicola]